MFTESEKLLEKKYRFYGSTKVIKPLLEMWKSQYILKLVGQGNSLHLDKFLYVKHTKLR